MDNMRGTSDLFVDRDVACTRTKLELDWNCKRLRKISSRRRV